MDLVLVRQTSAGLAMVFSQFRTLQYGPHMGHKPGHSMAQPCPVGLGVVFVGETGNCKSICAMAWEPQRNPKQSQHPCKSIDVSKQWSGVTLLRISLLNSWKCLSHCMLSEAASFGGLFPDTSRTRENNSRVGALLCQVAPSLAVLLDKIGNVFFPSCLRRAVSCNTPEEVTHSVLTSQSFCICGWIPSQCMHVFI